MKTSIGSILVGMCLLFSTPVFALTISDVSVAGYGAPDSLIYWGNVKPSNQEAELNFFSEAFDDLGIDEDVSDWHLRTYDFEASNYDGWYKLTDSPAGSDLWAFDFGLNFRPEYFLIKLGGKVEYGGGTFNSFLYENIGSLQYAVVDLGVFGDSGIKLEKIGHMSVPNPEPSTLLLLGAGIVGLVVYRRKKL